MSPRVDPERIASRLLMRLLDGLVACVDRLPFLRNRILRRTAERKPDSHPSIYTMY